MKYQLYKILPVKIRFLISYLLSDKFIIGLVAFVIHNKKILLIKHTYQYAWALPGGWLKKGESIEDCIPREMDEELNLKVKFEKVFNVFSVIKKPVIDIVVVCKALSGHVIPDKDEVEDAKFFDLIDLPDNILTAHRKYLNMYLTK